MREGRVLDILEQLTRCQIWCEVRFRPEADIRMPAQPAQPLLLLASFAATP